MNRIIEEVKGCRRCGLWRYRHRPVVGEGDLGATVMFIGEAPGYHEDLQGRPFVGAAGKLLSELLSSIGLSRDGVYITNVLKCRPPGNRDPRPDEVEACAPFLDRQIEIIKPRLIVTLGRHSTSHILKKMNHPFRSMSTAHGRAFRGRLFRDQVTVVPTYHPAAVLYNPKYRGAIEDDFRIISRELKEIQRVRDLRDFT